MCKCLPTSFHGFFKSVEEGHSHFTRMVGRLGFKYSRTNYRRFSVACKGPVGLIWNEIPAAIHNTKTMYQFVREWKDYVNTNH